MGMLVLGVRAAPTWEAWRAHGRTTHEAWAVSLQGAAPQPCRKQAGDGSSTRVGARRGARPAAGSQATLGHVCLGLVALRRVRRGYGPHSGRSCHLKNSVVWVMALHGQRWSPGVPSLRGCCHGLLEEVASAHRRSVTSLPYPSLCRTRRCRVLTSASPLCRNPSPGIRTASDV